MKTYLHLIFISVLIFTGCSKGSNNLRENPQQETLDTLITVNVYQPDYNSLYSNIYFVASDADGNIISEIKHDGVSSIVKITAPKSFKQDRFNFFRIDVSKFSGLKSSVTAYLQIKKGSVYHDNPVTSLPQKPLRDISFHLKNVIGFNNLLASTDFFSFTIPRPADTIIKLPYPASTESKLLVQIKKDNGYFYNFYDATTNGPNADVDINVDMDKLTKAATLKNITSAGSNLAIKVYGRPDKSYRNAYDFGTTTTTGSQLNYYYPTESFAEYVTSFHYDINNAHYNIITSTETVPDKAPMFDAVINTKATNLKSFTPAYSGIADYYLAVFENNPTTPDFRVYLFSPIKANYANVKLPNLAKYAGFEVFDPAHLSLKSFILYQSDGFNETDIIYPTAINTIQLRNFNMKSVQRTY